MEHGGLGLVFFVGLLCGSLLSTIILPHSKITGGRTFLNQRLPNHNLQYIVPPVAEAAIEENQLPRRRWNATIAKEEGHFNPEHKDNLNDADREILARIYFESNSVIEWGVGESTVIAAFTRLPRYTGVDGSIDWLNNVTALSPPHYRFHWADTGPITHYSHPTNTETAKPKFPFYSMGPLSAESRAFDFYFVDGRFRVACVCAAFLHASAYGKKPNEFRVALHDFSKRQSKYQDLLEFAERVDGFVPGSTTLASYKPGSPAHMAVFRRKASATDEQIHLVWEKHATDPGWYY